MKARKIILKKFVQTDPFTKEEIKDERGKPAEFSYRQQLWVILRTPNRNETFTTEEMMKRAQLQFLLEQTKDNESLLLEEAHYEILKKALDTFQWGGVTYSFAEMVKHVHEAEEVELQPAEKPKLDNTDKSLA